MSVAALLRHDLGLRISERHPRWHPREASLRSQNRIALADWCGTGPRRPGKSARLVYDGGRLHVSGPPEAAHGHCLAAAPLCSCLDWHLRRAKQPPVGLSAQDGSSGRWEAGTPPTFPRARLQLLDHCMRGRPTLRRGWSDRVDRRRPAERQGRVMGINHQSSVVTVRRPPHVSVRLQPDSTGAKAD